MWDISEARPECSQAASESPPLIMVMVPSLVSARMSTIPNVPLLNFSKSNTPIGPFMMAVLQSERTAIGFSPLLTAPSRFSSSLARRSPEIAGKRNLVTQCARWAVPNEHIEGGSKLLNEFCLVLGLFLVVFSSMMTSPSAAESTKAATSSPMQSGAKKLTHALGTWSKGELVLWSILRASQVRADSYDGSLLSEVFNSGDG